MRAITACLHCSCVIFSVCCYAAGLNILVSFVLDAFIGELESSDAEAAELAAAEGGRDGTGSNDYDPPTFHHVYSSRSMAVAVVDGSLLADSTDIKGTTTCFSLWYHRNGDRIKVLPLLIPVACRYLESTYERL